MNESLQPLFYPDRVAIIGASNTPGKLGFLLVRNLNQAFTGDIYPVNPGESEIQGLPAYPDITQTPTPPDLVIIATPPGTVRSLVLDCATSGARVAIILSGGFAETGAAGGALEQELLTIARRGDLRLLGPNCFGVINTAIGLNASLGFGLPQAGGVSLITQSGAYGMTAFGCSKEGSIGFSKIVAPGNTIDIDEVDLLRFLRDDSQTTVIAMLLESISRGRELFDELRTTTRTKPVIILKTGRSESGRRAAASHTAALATDYALTAGALKQAGAHLVDDGQTLLDTCSALEKQASVRGRRVAIITNSGGTGVELTDLLEEHGMQVPVLSKPLQSRIQEHLPAHGSARNPIDVTTQWNRFAEMYRSALRLLLHSNEVDAVVPVLLQRSALMPEVAEGIIDEVVSARREGHTKPVHICWVAGPEGDSVKRTLLDHGLPVNVWPLRTVRVLAACVQQPVAPAAELSGPCLPAPENVLPDTWLAADHCYRLVESAGIRTAAWQIVQSRKELKKIAETFKFPMALKALRPGLLHKSNVGGVALGIKNTSELLTAADRMEHRLGTGPFFLQQQIDGSAELFLGAIRDRSFGPAILFGVGGTMIELFDDTSVRLAPICVEEAIEMLKEIRAQKLLDGYRGHPPIDRPKLARLISEFSSWVASAPWMDQIDINPLIACGGDFVAVDVRIHAGHTRP